MKRCLWDVEVSLTVVNLAEAQPKPYTITLPLNDLSVFEYVRNLPLPEEDVLVVNLVHAGLSPWPVCGKALQCLVDISKPFAISEHSDLEPHMRRCGTSLYPLLLCADALCLTKEARRGLDGPVKTLLTQQFTPLLLVAPRLPYGNNSYVQLSETWVKLQGGPYVLEMDAAQATAGVWAGDTAAKAEVLLPVARWAALELYHLLDVLCMEQSVGALATLLVDPGLGLLWADINWVQQLKQQVTSDRLSAAGRQALFAAALATGASVPSQLPLHVGSALELSMKEVIRSGKQLCHGARIQFHADSCIWLPLVISK